LSAGKKARLQRILYQFGAKNGTLMVLPIDQGLEHGPIDFFENPASQDPNYHFKLAIEGNYNAIALHYGLAHKYYQDYAGKIPLILKLNGKTCIPNDDEAFSSLTATVEDAVRLGADAVGYTLFVGSPRQDEDFEQFVHVRNEAEKFGIPVIVWSYPRGKAVAAKGGKESSYAIEYAARVACELGADIVKVNFTHGATPTSPKPYDTLDMSDYGKVIKRVLDAAGRTMVIFSGGALASDDEMLRNVQFGMENGATGVIFGRNMWQRPHDKGLEFAGKVQGVLKKHSR